MPSLSLNVGLNNGRKLPFGGGGAPSGIVVATTTNVIITFGDTSSKNYERTSYPAFTNYNINEPAPGIAFQVLDFNGEVANTWALSQYAPVEEPALVIQATNTSINPLIIPTTGWTYTVGSGPAITITAG